MKVDPVPYYSTHGGRTFTFAYKNSQFVEILFPISPATIPSVPYPTPLLN